MQHCAPLDSMQKNFNSRKRSTEFSMPTLEKSRRVEKKEKEKPEKYSRTKPTTLIQERSCLKSLMKKKKTKRTAEGKKLHHTRPPKTKLNTYKLENITQLSHTHNLKKRA